MEVFQCQICKKEYSLLLALCVHIGRTHKNISAKEYYDKYFLKEGENICHNKNCSNENKFISIAKGYTLYCCHNCSTKCEIVIEKRKRTSLKNWGVDNPSKSNIVKEKVKKTYIKHYGVDNPNKSDVVKEKIRNTLNERYGVDCIFQLKEIQNKIKEGNLKKYGTEYIFQAEEIKERTKKINLERYGVEYPSQSKEIREKIKQSCLTHYGCEHPLKSSVVKQRREETCLQKYNVRYSAQCENTKKKIREIFQKNYKEGHPSKSKLIKEKKQLTFLKNFGVNNPFKSDIVKEKIRETCLKKYGVPYSSKSEIIKKKIKFQSKITFFNKLINSNRLKSLITPNFTIEHYSKVTQKYSWTCLKCNTIFEDDLDNGKIPRCPKCFPPLAGTSKSEQELLEFIKSLDVEVIQHDRSILNGKELDIFIPSHKLAIELNGLYWHSEIGGNTSYDYHLNKTLQCQKKGIQLIHIFEDEWSFTQNIIKSIIKSKLELIKNRMFARKCIIQPVDYNLAFNFLESNHLQGFINGTHLGLYFNNELVSILTYGKSRFNHKYEIEIYRFCNKINTVVMGALSKLISHINSKSIISYVDLRYGNGKSYEKIGFKKLGQSKPNYFYMKNYLNREYRLNYQKYKLKSKLKIFDENLTEWQNMQLNQYDRIWDCGNLIYTLERG